MRLFSSQIPHCWKSLAAAHLTHRTVGYVINKQGELVVINARTAGLYSFSDKSNAYMKSGRNQVTNDLALVSTSAYPIYWVRVTDKQRQFWRQSQ